jgi:putative oxidoreductase
MEAAGFRCRVSGVGIAIWAARLAIAAVFLYAAVPKIIDPPGFAKSIYNYQMMPDAVINPMALFLPWLELFTALALLGVPALRRGALWLLGGMLVVFVVAISSAMARGLNIDCGCFSTTGEGTRAALPHLILDIVLLAAAFWLWFADDGGRRTDDGRR